MKIYKCKLIKIYFNLFISTGVTITTKVPEVFEVGKPATIECDIVYNEIKDIKVTTLYYMDTNGKPIKIGDSINGFKINPVENRANIFIKVDKVKIMFNKLEYNDKFVFVCTVYGADKDFRLKPDKKNASISIQNIKGNIITTRNFCNFLRKSYNNYTLYL